MLTNMILKYFQVKVIHKCHTWDGNHVCGNIGRYLDDGCDELVDDVVLQQVGPEVLHEVDQQPLDVGPIVILVVEATVCIVFSLGIIVWFM